MSTFLSDEMDISGKLFSGCREFLGESKEVETRLTFHPTTSRVDDIDDIPVGDLV